MSTKPAILAFGLLATPVCALAAEADGATHTVTTNISLVSEYLYRGIAQTRGRPALQGGIDYSHRGGFHTGVSASTISWIEDGVSGASADIELDVLGGYRWAANDVIGFDVGVLSYNYPGSDKTPGGTLRQDSIELYGTVSWRWLSVTYWRSTTALFGLARTGTTDGKTRGSTYLEFNAGRDLGHGWGITGHLGRQTIRDNRNASYTDYRIGVSRKLRLATLSLSYSNTNASADCSQGDTYCFVRASDGKGYDAGQGRVVLGIGTTF